MLETSEGYYNRFLPESSNMVPRAPEHGNSNVNFRLCGDALRQGSYVEPGVESDRVVIWSDAVEQVGQPPDITEELLGFQQSR